jgi:sugar phosphate isomerase/epimerase
MNANAPYPLSRRQFLARTAAASAPIILGSPRILGQAAAPSRLKIGGFSKPFQKFSPDETADFVAEIGWEGIECPVRKAGQILPERVETDLPKMAEALKKRNLAIFTIATDIKNVSDPFVEKTLRVAASVGIKIYRLAHLQYDLSKPIPPQLDNIRGGLKELAALNDELGLCAAYENHSGASSVGAPLWDIYSIINGFDPRRYGFCFDLGHATIEGGLDWRVQFRLIQSFLAAIYVKDFVWQKTDGKWDAAWRPLGQGMIDPAFFNILARTAFNGPIIQHHEYPLGDKEEMKSAMRRDLRTLKSWMGANNGPPA